jgi:hypothetical protein
MYSGRSTSPSTKSPQGFANSESEPSPSLRYSQRWLLRSQVNGDVNLPGPVLIVRVKPPRQPPG